MILRWGFKTLAMQKSATLGNILGIALAFLLALFFAGVWQGETEQIVAYPQTMHPDIWVMQEGVSNMHMAISFLWDWKADVIKKMPEVEQVTPILYLNSVIQVKDGKLFGFVVGLTDSKSRAGPWHISRGRTLKADDEIVAPDPLTTIYGVQLGDSIRVVDQDYRVVGFSTGTYSSANPVFFVLKPRLEQSLASAGTYSYLLVDARPGTDIAALRTKIMTNVDKVNVLTHAEFIANDFAMARQMGAETILIMTLICSGLAALIIGYSCYSLTLKKKKEIAIIKAVGARNLQLLITIFLQSLTVTILAYLLTLVLLLVIQQLLPILAPQITLRLSWSLLLKPLGFAIMVAVAGSFYPALQMMRLDPALAYKNG